jgi:hypothetical protein
VILNQIQTQSQMKIKEAIKWVKIKWIQVARLIQMAKKW